MLSTDEAWEKFGKNEPYFGVLADEKFTAANIQHHRDEFFASGERSVAHLITQYEKHFGRLQRGRALDHGCGVGRLSFPLSRRFDEVLGLDVSPSMLAEAKTNGAQFAAPNLQFAQADDELSNASGDFDFVNSWMVLQHVPVRRGLTILSRLVEKVRPGGGFHIHLSLRTDGLRSRALWWASHHIPGVKIWQNVFAGRSWNAPAMQMNNYPLNQVIVLLKSLGILEVLVSTERHADFITCSLVGQQSPLQ